MDVREAANKLGVSNQTIYNMLNDGRLKATKVGVSWDIPDEEINRRLEESTQLIKEAGSFSLSVELLDTVYANDFDQNVQDILQKCQEVLQSYAEIPSGKSDVIGFKKNLNDLSNALDRYKTLEEVDMYVKRLRMNARTLQLNADVVRLGMDI